MCVTFQKYHGLGNDYLVYDCEENSCVLSPENIRMICSTNFGLGSDGIMIGPIWKDNGIYVQVFNPDGSEAENGGNGLCIFAKYLKDKGYIHRIPGYLKDNTFTLYTLGGSVLIHYDNESGSQITMNMGAVSFKREDIGCIHTPEEVVDVPFQFGEETFSCTCVSVGNPHCVIPMRNVYKKRVCEIGEFSENASWFPNRINTQIVKVLDRKHIQIEIFERGAGYTLASATSSCAAAAAVYRLGLTDADVCVNMPGGSLIVCIHEDWTVTITGEVCSVGKMILTDEFIHSNRIGR